MACKSSHARYPDGPPFGEDKMGSCSSLMMTADRSTMNVVSITTNRTYGWRAAAFVVALTFLLIDP